MSEKELVGYASVDSGHIIITDPCYLVEPNISDYREKGFWNSTFMKKELGVIVHTKIGDGVFPVYFEEENGGGIGKSRIIIELDS